MTFYNPFDDPKYYGYCKCSPCQCDGHGNFGEQENVGWAEVNLLSKDGNAIPVHENDIQPLQSHESEFTYEDGTPVPEYRGRRLRGWK